MATPILIATEPATNDGAVDYLGHPCMVTEAFARFDYAVKEARKLDPREVVRQIGILLNRLTDRGEHSGNALNLALDSLPNSTDEDGVRALLTMAIAYDAETANGLYRLAGCMLVALEQGKLLEPNHG